MPDASAPSPLHLLHRAGQCADELFASNVGDSDLTPRQFAVLKAIADSNEPSQTGMVQTTGVIPIRNAIAAMINVSIITP